MKSMWNLEISNSWMRIRFISHTHHLSIPQQSQCVNSLENVESRCSNSPYIQPYRAREISDKKEAKRKSFPSDSCSRFSWRDNQLLSNIPRALSLLGDDDVKLKLAALELKWKLWVINIVDDDETKRRKNKLKRISTLSKCLLLLRWLRDILLRSVRSRVEMTTKMMGRGRTKSRGKRIGDGWRGLRRRHTAEWKRMEQNEGKKTLIN